MESVSEATVSLEGWGELTEGRVLTRAVMLWVVLRVWRRGVKRGAVVQAPGMIMMSGVEFCLGRSGEVEVEAMMVRRRMRRAMRGLSDMILFPGGRFEVL